MIAPPYAYRVPITVPGPKGCSKNWILLTYRVLSWMGVGEGERGDRCWFRLKPWSCSLLASGQVPNTSLINLPSMLTGTDFH